MQHNGRSRLFTQAVGLDMQTVRLVQTPAVVKRARLVQDR
jgi:hypothetical protein